ncbi:MAG TPA: hypothetical protein VJ773_02545 [Gemmatimonadales bacterium]|nr:hypothetical protein [Gemmatimonadales bacterium]
MRGSSARLAGSTVRLGDLGFPASRFLLARTRALFVHLDNLVSFAKRDRDGRVDGYLAAWLPEEVLLLFVRRGELVNAAALTATGREVLPVGEALRRIRTEPERGEIAYGEAPIEQLEWMFASAARPPEVRSADVRDPARLFPILAAEGYTGVAEFISQGRVNYLRFEAGRFAGGHTTAPADTPLAYHIESLFQLLPDGTPPAILLSTLGTPAPLPTQALPSQIRMLREVYARLVRSAEGALPGEGTRKSERAHQQVITAHPDLAVLGPGDRTEGQAVSAEALTAALAAWATGLLREVELVDPGAGPRLLGEATRDHRHALQAAGFFEQVPWSPLLP